MYVTLVKPNSLLRTKSCKKPVLEIKFKYNICVCVRSLLGNNQMMGNGSAKLGVFGDVIL